MVLVKIEIEGLDLADLENAVKEIKEKEYKVNSYKILIEDKRITGE